MRSWLLRLLSLALVLPFALLASPARADFPSVNTRRFQPSVDPAGSLYLEPTGTPGPWAYNGAAWFAYAYRPDVLRDASGTMVAKLVSHQLTADVVSNLGIGERFALGFDLPVVVYQKGDDNATTRAVAGRTPPMQALGDIAILAKGNIISYGQLGGFGLSTLLRYTAPTGDTASYLGQGASTGELRLLAEYKVIAVSVQGTAGFRLRFEERDVLRRTFNHEVPWGAAISFRPQVLGWDDKGRFTWVAEVHGAGLVPPTQAAQDRGQKTPVAPILAGLSARYAPSDVSFVLGAETSASQAFGSPPLQVIASLAWAPRVHDRDHDGVPDDVDQCPELAEDRDGFEDADGCPDWDNDDDGVADTDGCPDWDNDDDGVADTDDRCPREKEDIDGFEDADGCPDPDNDKDGVRDPQDACPNEPGPRRADPKTNGCPDKDNDGVPDKLDKCPEQAEDIDGFEDADGCPDPDNDKDGVADAQDVCPNVPAGAMADPRRPGCPASDKDGDTIEDSADKCPNEAETFNGVDDDDGCPDTGGKPLVVIQTKGADISARFSAPVKFKGSREAPEVDPASLVILRALAVELNRHPTWIVAVGVRPSRPTAVEQQAALARAFVVVDALRKFAYRDGAAETIGWRAVAKEPDAARTGFGVLVLSPPPIAQPDASKK